MMTVDCQREGCNPVGDFNLLPHLHAPCSRESPPLWVDEGARGTRLRGSR